MSGENVTIDEPARAGRSRFWGRWVDAIVVFMLAPLPLNLLVVALARPGVLTRHPLLRAYCDFMARIVPSIPKWTAVSAFPQITALAFSIAWGCGIPLFFMVVIWYLLRWKQLTKRWETVVERRTPTDLVLIGFGFPVMLIAVLGDAGVIHFVGFYRGIGFPRGLNDPWTHLVSTSKLGLAMLSWALAGFVGYGYPILLAAPVFYTTAYKRFMRRFRKEGEDDRSRY